MASIPPLKVPTISEWDTKYKLPKDLNDLLATYDSQPGHPAEKQPIRNDRKIEAAEISENQELESLTLKENTNPNYHLLKEAIRFEEWIHKALNGVIQNAKDYEANIKQIDDIKSSVIEKINKFYEESSVLLEQQKVYVDTGVHVQSILSYFQDYEKLEKDIENLSLNIANIHIYEPNLQRFLSEIMDAIEFFQSKPNYKNSQEFQDKYDKLKRKILSIIKSMFIKIFTRDYAEINKEMDKFQYDKLEILNKEIVVNREKNKELLAITYPEIASLFNTQTSDLVQNTEGRYLNRNLRDLLSYLNLLTRFDFDCVDTLNDLFGSYYGTFRKTIQMKVLENIVNQLHRIHPKELQVVVSKMVSYVLQTIFFELIYHNYFFNNSIQFTESSLIGIILKGLLEKYYEYIYSFIQIEHELKNFFEAVDILNYYISPLESNIKRKDSKDTSIDSNSTRVSESQYDEKTEREKNFVAGIFQNIENEGNFKNLLAIQKKLKDEDGNNFDKFMDLFVNFLKRIRSDINIKLSEKIQYYVNNYIGNFNINQYWKEFNQKYNSHPNEIKKNDIYKSPFFRIDMKGEIFPLAKTASDLLNNLKNRTERKSFQSIYNQIITITVNNIYLASDLFMEKTDSFLFLIKNLIFIVEKLEEYSIRLRVEDDEGLNKVEAGLFEKLVMNVSLFGGKKVSQKMIEFGCDLKMEPSEHLERVSDIFIEDIEFIISIKMVEYLKRYQYLESHINDGYVSKGSSDKLPSIQDVPSEKDQATGGAASMKPNEVRKRVEADAVKKEIESMLNKDMVKKYYLMFTQNMEEILQDLCTKMLHYLNDEDFEKLSKLVEIIINNLMDLLSQFYVLVSKHYSEIEYNEFNFVEIDKFKEKLSALFVKNS